MQFKSEYMYIMQDNKFDYSFLNCFAAHTQQHSNIVHQFKLLLTALNRLRSGSNMNSFFGITFFSILLQK